MAKSSRVKPSLIQITDSAELSDYQFRTRKHFEERFLRSGGNFSEWVKYAKWEESQSQKYFPRARSIFERALLQAQRYTHCENPILWLNYAEFEMRNGSFDLARNVWDRAVSSLPSVNQLWYKYIRMEEVTLGNIAMARQLFQRWMELEPDAQSWFSYASFELRYGEVDRARDIYERLVRCDISPDAWAQYAQFEMKNGEVQRCRAIYLRATQIVHPEDREALFLAFVKFQELRNQMDPATCIHNAGGICMQVEHQGVAAETMKRFHASKLRNESRDIQYHVNSEFHASKKRNGGRHIPYDLMLNILSRVPARSLVRFRCACKLWNSLFHDRYFVKLQLNHSAKNPTTFIGCTSNEDWDRVVFFSFELEASKLVCGDKFTVPVPVPAEFGALYHMTNACDGLIAFYGSWFAFVANPSTREWMAVPMVSMPMVSMRNQSLGLGFSNATEKYKLVWIYYDGGDLHCNVVTIGTDRTWRRLGKIHYRIDTTFSPAYSNGFIYWTVNDDDFVLALNVSQEEFVKIPLPQRHHPKPYGNMPVYCYLCMRILEESLCLVDFRVYRDHHRSVYVPFMHIYVLESHSAAEGGDPPVWRESHNLRLRSVEVPRDPAQFTMLPIFIRDDKLLLLRYYKSWSLHDMLTGACPPINLPQEESSFIRGWSTSFTCAASIAPIVGC